MAQLDTLDFLVLSALIVGTLLYLSQDRLWRKTSQAYTYANGNGNLKAAAVKSRNIIEKMDESGKNCVVFFGSQTGTAEDFASRLAKEGSQRFGLKTMVADLEDYDYDNLDTWPEDKVAMFLLATYGEGEPTDNAVEFYELISSEDVTFSGDGSVEDQPLSSLKYVAFGLGNNTYEHYNAMVRLVDVAFKKLGAQRIGDVGEGDDGAGTMEEDFLAWKESMWKDLCQAMKLEERESVYEPVFEIHQKPELDANNDTVYLGEPNRTSLEAHQMGPYNAHNPYIAPIKTSKELFTVRGRNCLHMEIDISASNLVYTTGDHIAIWPTNAGIEVDRFLRVLGLEDKRHTVINVRGIDPTAKVPFPCPTTYDAVARYYLEICAPVSRQMISTIIPFSPNEESKVEITKLGNDPDYFKEKVSRQYLNLAQILEIIAKQQVWPIPFSLILEGVVKIQPRYYSISSSSLVQKNTISITAAVESIRIPGSSYIMKGVTTNYLLALKEKQNGEPDPNPYGLTYAIGGPRNKYDGIHVPVHVRNSNFKLPSDSSRPIIMIGPGTGVAPFRGFVQERAARAKAGENVGKTMLFFGCRKRTEDFIYQDEWKKYQEDLGDKFELVTAFSREQARKVYVQHRLREYASEINTLLQKQKANVYVCGDAANMAREVNATLVEIIAHNRNVTKGKAEDIVKSMRARNQYQEDVWS